MIGQWGQGSMTLPYLQTLPVDQIFEIWEDIMQIKAGQEKQAATN